jgi:RNA polymerase sigma-70 factor (ECF subfamily)
MEFQTIFKEYRPRIFRYLVRLVGPVEAEDLCQEVFLKVNLGLAGFRAEAKVSTWLYRIATNAAADLRRRKGFSSGLLLEHRQELDDDLAIVEPPLAAGKGCLQKGIEHREMNACVRALLDEIPEKYRIILVLSEIEGFSGKEIGEILGLTLSTVKMRLHRGRAQLREVIGQNCRISLDGRNEVVCEPKLGAVG